MDAVAEEMITKAIEHGNEIGQVALAEFILRDYGKELSYNLKRFLEKVCENSYTKIGNNAGKPAEDVALQVGQMMEKRMA